MNVQGLINDIEYMTGRLYAGQNKDGLDKLQDIISKLGDIADGYVSLTNEMDKIVMLNQMLSNVNQAIKNSDFVLLADIFEYEIVAILKDMLNMLKGNTTN